MRFTDRWGEKEKGKKVGKDQENWLRKIPRNKKEKERGKGMRKRDTERKKIWEDKDLEILEKRWWEREKEKERKKEKGKKETQKIEESKREPGESEVDVWRSINTYRWDLRDAERGT